VTGRASPPIERGPSGRAPPPPAGLAEMDLPFDVIPEGTLLLRVHGKARDPIFFGPVSGGVPTYRFDSLRGAFGVLYLGRNLAGAVVETLLRNPARKMVAYDDLADRASSEVSFSRDLKLARPYGTGLQLVGCDNSISTGPYEPCGAWADALWDHHQRPDGVAYQSRHDSSEICIALFKRPDLVWSVGPPQLLTDQLKRIAGLLGKYGKSISMPAR